MKVEIWAEIACPWCGLGGHRLDRAVERFEHSGHVEVVHRSFPLGSGLPEDRTLSVRDFVLGKYGVIPGQAGVPDIEGMAAAEGLAPYRVLDNRVGNTDLADEIGLDREQTRQVLADRRYRRQVQADAHQAQQLGATGAPFTVIDGRYALAGPDGCAVPAAHA